MGHCHVYAFEHIWPRLLKININFICIEIGLWLWLLIMVMCRGIFVTEHAGTLFRKLFLRRKEAGTAFQNFFFPAIDITRLGVSCYPTALLSNKLA
jgi:hypothetical protein